MLEPFTAAMFAPHIGETFRLIASESEWLDLTLSTVEERDQITPTPERKPFTLLFHGPHSPIAPQRTYRFAHATIGEFDLFIVPVGPDQAVQRYEAVFG